MIDPEHQLVQDNPWTSLRRFTRARVALGRAGTSLPTQAMLEFQLDHAKAVDAVHHELCADTLAGELDSLASIAAINAPPIVLRSKAEDRFAYLQRPDLGRELREADCQRLHELRRDLDGEIDLAIVVADGLSALAVERHAAPFLAAFTALLAEDPNEWNLAPVCIARQARVAIGDDIGESFNARASMVLIGERPGLSSPDSMGIYLTWGPERRTLDSSRNCISNIRPGGLAYGDAAAKAFYLLKEAFRREVTGIALKDRSNDSDAATGLSDDPRGQFRLTGNTATGDTLS